ncbi:MAG: hypothetical protein Q7K48_07435, partial [Fusobacterium sp. JB021]|nr:hypothetical protein [Fusobacterium sp. JB021]
MAKKWTKEKIKNLLLKEYKKKNITLSSKEIINNKYLPNPDIINKYFGKNLIDVWKEIEKQERIVLNYRKNKEIKTKINKETIIERTKELAKKLGKIPTLREYKKEYGFNQIFTKFEKGYLEVLFRAGFIPKWKFGMSKEEMIDYLQEKIDSGELKSFKELMFNREFPTLKIIYKSLGCKSLKEIEEIIDRVFVIAKREKRGYKSIKYKSNEELINEYKLLCEKLGKVASGREISENLGYSSN